MMIIQGTIELGYNIRSAWFLDIRISTCFSSCPNPVDKNGESDLSSSESSDTQRRQ